MKNYFSRSNAQICPTQRKSITRLPTVRAEHNQLESSYHQLQGYEKSHSVWLGFLPNPTSCSRVDKPLANHLDNAARSVGHWLTIHQKATTLARSPRPRILLPIPPVHHLLRTHQAGEVVSALSSTRYSLTGERNMMIILQSSSGTLHENLVLPLRRARVWLEADARGPSPAPTLLSLVCALLSYNRRQ